MAKSKGKKGKSKPCRPAKRTARVKRECVVCGGNKGMRGRYPPADGMCAECRKADRGEDTIAES